MWLFHLHSAVKNAAFFPVFPLAGSTAKAFFRLSLWSFKGKALTIFYGCVIENGWCFISWNSKEITNKISQSWSPPAENGEKHIFFSILPRQNNHVPWQSLFHNTAKMKCSVGENTILFRLSRFGRFLQGPVVRMWLSHPHSMVKIRPFSPVFLSAGPMPEAFGVILLELQENISQSLW